MSIKFYDYLLTILKPVIICLGKIGLPKRKFTGEHYFKYRDSINIGDFFLTKTNYEFSNLLNPCKIKHGAIYVGNAKGNEVKYVLEATGHGVVLTDLVTFLTTKDTVILVENKFQGNYEDLPNILKSVLGIPYDYLFDDNGKAFYCFELCAHFNYKIFPHQKLRIKEIVKNKKIYDHESFLDDNIFRIKLAIGVNL